MLAAQPGCLCERGPGHDGRHKIYSGKGPAEAKTGFRDSIELFLSFISEMSPSKIAFNNTVNI